MFTWKRNALTPDNDVLITFEATDLFLRWMVNVKQGFPTFL